MHIFDVYAKLMKHVQLVSVSSCIGEGNQAATKGLTDLLMVNNLRRLYILLMEEKSGEPVDTVDGQHPAPPGMVKTL